MHPEVAPRLLLMRVKASQPVQGHQAQTQDAADLLLREALLIHH